jgi:hypothetical protein
MGKKFYPDRGVTWQNLHSVMNNPDDEHIFDCSFETKAYFTFDKDDTIYSDRQKHLEFLEYHDNTKVKPTCKVLTCAFDFEGSGQPFAKRVGLYAAMENFPIVPDWTEVISWKTRSFYNAILERAQYLEKAKTLINTPTNEKLFVSLIQRPKPHRVELMKILLDRNVVDWGSVRFANSKVTWNRVLEEKKFRDNHYDKLLSHAPDIFSPYKFKSDSGSPGWHIDPCYPTGFFDISPESFTNVNVITQKSCQPILWKKPFCMIGSANQNTVLKDMGFELFEEVFDYSDETPVLMDVRTSAQLHDHYDKMLTNLWEIERTPESYKSWNEKFAPKYEHNLNRMIQLTFDDDCVPNEVLEHKESHAYKQVCMARAAVINDPYYEKYIPALPDMSKYVVGSYLTNPTP